MNSKKQNMIRLSAGEREGEFLGYFITYDRSFSDGCEYQQQKCDKFSKISPIVSVNDITYYPQNLNVGVGMNPAVNNASISFYSETQVMPYDEVYVFWRYYGSINGDKVINNKQGANREFCGEVEGYGLINYPNNAAFGSFNYNEYQPIQLYIGPSSTPLAWL